MVLHCHVVARGYLCLYGPADSTAGVSSPAQVANVVFPSPFSVLRRHRKSATQIHTLRPPALLALALGAQPHPAPPSHLAAPALASPRGPRPWPLRPSLPPALSTLGGGIQIQIQGGSGAQRRAAEDSNSPRRLGGGAEVEAAGGGVGRRPVDRGLRRPAAGAVGCGGPALLRRSGRRPGAPGTGGQRACTRTFRGVLHCFTGTIPP